MPRSALVDTITASAVTVVENLHGDVNQTVQMAARPVHDFIRDFDLEAEFDGGFVGRDAVFEQLDAFGMGYRAGYFEIIGAAGLGKTALAVEIARRRDAVAFLASASSNAHRPDQFLEHVSATLIVRHGLGYATLPARVSDDATFLDRILRESVQRAGGPIWVVVDGLDEADPPAPGSNPLLLPPKLPAGVYVVVTRRTGRLATHPGTPVWSYTLRWDDPLQTGDLARFVDARVGADRRIADALATAQPPISREDFVARLVQASEGNFMYASFILADVAGRGPEGGAEAPTLDLTDLPSGLEAYYDQFWARMSWSQTQGWADWEGLYQPVIERLAVAREAVTADWLGAQIGRPPGEVRARVLEAWARVLSRGRHDGWRLVHRTFGEYLERKLDLRDAHRKVAESYVERRWGQFDRWDAYGLRHTATHLAEASDRSAAPERHELIAELVRLVTDQGFQRAHLSGLQDPTLLQRDLDLAHRLAAKDEHQDATFLVVPVALTGVLFHRRLLRPEALFAAARTGDVQAAERLLDLFSGTVDPDWHDAILLTVAWLASAATPGEASRVRDRIRDARPPSATMTRLLDRVTAALDGATPAPAPLPPPATPEDGAIMLARLGGAGELSSLGLAGLDPELHGGELRGEGVYLAASDGPQLVALAAAAPTVGDRLLARYLEVHRAYGYPQYRNGSLWELLDAILRHPSQAWVRDWLVRMGSVVLAAPNRGEFLEGLEIAVLVLQANAGDSAAAQEFDARRADAARQAAALPPSPLRGQGDVWALHRRRLAAFAEASSRFPAAAPNLNPAELVQLALALGEGFAGITAPANLTLAETVSVATPAVTSWAERALADAEAAAHNIQDFTFCARTTARVTAMRERWWGMPPLDRWQLADTVNRLSRDRSTAEFGAVHIVGEQYEHRNPISRALMPQLMLTADTLADLAAIYQRPVEEFVRYNQDRGWAPGQHLPVGTRVNVPDPGFPPLVAARLSAAILADGPPDPERSALLRHLVPVTGTDVTALGTVLARLLLCSPTQDANLLAELRRLVSEVASPAVE
jgi:hypothetical protein